MSIAAISIILDTISFDRVHKLPTVTSITEFKGDAGYGKYQCIITYPASYKTLDILTSCSEAKLQAFFRHYPRGKDKRGLRLSLSTYGDPTQLYEPTVS